MAAPTTVRTFMTLLTRTCDAVCFRISRAKHCQPVTAKHEMLLLQKPNHPPDARTLKVAIIGSPNAGKSTLINSLMGQRICSVSSKVHTTRSNALAILTRNSTQIVFLDTPGMVNHLHGRKHRLARSLLVDPKNSLEEADLAVVLVDVSNKWTCEKISSEILMSLHLHPRVPSILILNKVDLINNKQDLFTLTAQLTEGVVGDKKFTIDEKTARHLGKVETRPMLSHKYKPRLPKEPEPSAKLLTGEVENTHSVRDASTGETNDETIYPCNPSKSGRLSVRDSSESQDLGISQNFNVETQIDHQDSGVASLSDTAEEHSNTQDYFASHIHNGNLLDGVSSENQDVQVSRDCPNVILPETKNCPQDSGRNDLPQNSDTIQEYLSSLEQFTSQIDGVSERQESLESAVAEADNKETVKAQQRTLLREMNNRNGWDRFEAVFMVSALDGEGIQDLQEHLMSKAVPGDWEYHEDVITNLSPEEILTEAVREKLLEHLPQEVPYNLKQKNELWTTEDSGTLRIIQKIIPNKRSHGKMLKRNIGRIALEAEESLCKAFACDVHLTLRIKL